MKNNSSSPKEEKIIRFKNSNEWRQWLIKHGSTEKVLWLTIQKKHSDNVGIKHSEALNEALCFGWIDGLLRSLNENEFNLRFTPRKKNSPWSLSNRKRAEELIAQNKIDESGMRAIEEAKKNGRWKHAYSSKESIPIPKILLTQLKNKDLLKYFNSLSNSKRQQYIYWILDAKKEETKTRRAEKVIELLMKEISK